MDSQHCAAEFPLDALPRNFLQLAPCFKHARLVWNMFSTS